MSWARGPCAQARLAWEWLALEGLASTSPQPRYVFTAGWQAAVVSTASAFLTMNKEPIITTLITQYHKTDPDIIMFVVISVCATVISVAGMVSFVELIKENARYREKENLRLHNENNEVKANHEALRSDYIRELKRRRTTISAADIRSQNNSTYGDDFRAPQASLGEAPFFLAGAFCRWDSQHVRVSFGKTYVSSARVSSSKNRKTDCCYLNNILKSCLESEAQAQRLLASHRLWFTGPSSLSRALSKEVPTVPRYDTQSGLSTSDLKLRSNPSLFNNCTATLPANLNPGGTWKADAPVYESLFPPGATKKSSLNRLESLRPSRWVQDLKPSRVTSIEAEQDVPTPIWQHVLIKPEPEAQSFDIGKSAAAARAGTAAGSNPSWVGLARPQQGCSTGPKVPARDAFLNPLSEPIDVRLTISPFAPVRSTVEGEPDQVPRNDYDDEDEAEGGADEESNEQKEADNICGIKRDRLSTFGRPDSVRRRTLQTNVVKKDNWTNPWSRLKQLNNLFARFRLVLLIFSGERERERLGLIA
ncbi:hypothetical protein PSHT_12608 [Puccinia striiformis]|uniref:Uncharacterized protein n=1 Tax=Puccinia striiformis TaxID=27350 RepID=A0A2S4UVR1_9BASI|nr:hypothetical protein PSHT_12608 [Puccinia striiformis]